MFRGFYFAPFELLPYIRGMVIRSAQFDDVYFSAEDGLAETTHVFLDGNNLPAAWDGQDDFTIGEMGFGTGLNFLAAWALFEKKSRPTQRLNFVSVEKYPLSKTEIKEALAAWTGELGVKLDRLLDMYPIRVPGPHVVHVTDRVTLTIWFGDVLECLPEWSAPIDAWFLDGFTPAKNPDMWSDDLFRHMARLSHDRTTYATFTAAGFVRRGLLAAGFTAEKTKGFGRKRDMVIGGFDGGAARPDRIIPQSIAIIGGGLAGCAMAYAFKRQGIKATIYEAEDSLASGASGGALGMINPKLTAKPSPQADYYMAAYAHALRVLSDIDGVDFNIHGSTHLCRDDDKDRRFTGYVENLGWHEDHIVRQGRDLYYPDGASVSPFKLCHALAKGAEVVLNHTVKSLSDIKEEVVILANGYALDDLIDGDLSLQSVRGQVSWVKPQSNINGNICFSGYVTPKTPDGFHILGSSYQPWDKNIDVREEDHADNIRRYNDAMDGNIIADDVIGGWAALRTASKDRFPIVGSLKDNIYVSTAHGSHGIISSLMAAEIIAMQLIQGAVPAFRSVLRALSPMRFHKY